MATNQLTLLRQWHMLRHIPRAPQKISVQELCARLHDADFAITDRSVQRDLKELSQVFPLEADERERPFGWSWQRDATGFNLPGISVPEALTLALVEQHLRNQLPPNTAGALQPHFASAARTLSAVDGSSPAKAWLNKVRSIPPMQPLLHPVIKEQCRDAVYGALMKDRQLRLHYRKRDAAELTVYESVHPLAVVQRGGVVYLVCMFGAYEDARTIPLHRIEAAEMLYEPARGKPGFELDQYIASGQFGVLTGDPVRLKARFSREAGEHLLETPLSEDQELLREDGGTLLLSATVPNTRALVWWLLGFGDGVTVLEPAALRTEIAGTARRMAAAYDGSDMDCRS